MSVKKFAVGRSYFTRMIGNSDLKVCITVLARTDKTITIKAKASEGGRKMLRIRVHRAGDESIEQVKPSGNHSMAPIVGADREMPADLTETDQTERVANEATERLPQMLTSPKYQVGISVVNLSDEIDTDGERERITPAGNVWTVEIADGDNRHIACKATGAAIIPTVKELDTEFAPADTPKQVEVT